MTDFQFERMNTAFWQCICSSNKSSDIAKTKGSIVLSINNFLNAMEIDNVRAVEKEGYPYIEIVREPTHSCLDRA